MPVRSVVDRLVLIMAVGWTVAVCVLSLTPSDPSEAVVGWDKARHAGAYAGLTLLWLAAAATPAATTSARSGTARSGAGRRQAPGVRPIAVAVGAIVLGIVLEVLQATVVDRAGDALDALADAAGAAAGLGAWLLARRFHARVDGRARLRSPDRRQPAAASPSPPSPSSH